MKVALATNRVERLRGDGSANCAAIVTDTQELPTVEHQNVNSYRIDVDQLMLQQEEAHENGNGK